MRESSSGRGDAGGGHEALLGAHASRLREALKGGSLEDIFG